MKTTKRSRKWVTKQRAEKYLQWAKKQYNEVNEQLFRDLLYTDTCMVHVNDIGDMKVIDPYSPEYWNIKDKIEWNKHMEKYGYPPASSTYTTMMTMDEIKEKYGTEKRDTNI